MVSVDGFFEGSDRDISWHNVDTEFNEYAIDLLNKVDTLLFGRITYELMESYWPNEYAIANDPIVAAKMNNLPKIVFSRSMMTSKWSNSRLIKENIAEEIRKLKQERGKDMAILGSSNLALTFIEHHLIDEYRIMINPIALGKGNTLFQGLRSKLNLKLLRTRTFKSGNIMLCYC